MIQRKFYCIGLFLILGLFKTNNIWSNDVLYLDLAQSLRVGVTNHFVLKTIKSKSSIIKKNISQKWRQYLPSLGINYSRQNEVLVGLSDTRVHDLRATVEQVLYDGGRLGLDLDIAKLEQLLLRDEFRIIYNKLKIDIQQAFIKTLAAKGKIKLYKKSLVRGYMQLQHAQKEYKLGFSTKVQVLDVAARVEEMKLSLLKAQNEYLQSLHDMKLVLNVNQDTQLFLKGDLFEDFKIQFKELNLNTLISLALKERPEILQSKVNIHRLKKVLQIAENYWIPKVSLQGYYAYNGEYFPLRDRSWGVNLVVSFPFLWNDVDNSIGANKSQSNSKGSTLSNNIQLFNNLAYDTDIIQGKIDLAQAIFDYKKLQQSIAIEIHKIFDDLKISWKTIEIGTNRVNYQFERLKIMNTQFKVGEIKRSDIVYAETEFIKALGELTDSIVQYLTMAYKMEIATGYHKTSYRLYRYLPGQGNLILKRMVDETIVKNAKSFQPKKLPDTFLLDQIHLDKKKENNFDENKN